MKTNCYLKNKYWLLISFLSTVALYFTMNHGSGVSTDSVVFLNAAEHILEHGEIYVTEFGKKVPMTHFPPLYSILLSLISFILNCSIECSAKIAAALCFGVNIFLIGIIFRKLKFKNIQLLPILILFIISEYMISVHVIIFTEPLFITFMLSGFIFLSDYLLNEENKYLFYSALFIALACLTRYVGLVLVGVGGLSILFFLHRKFLSRIKYALIFGVISLSPLCLWFIRNMILTTNPTNRHIIFHPLGVAHTRQFIRSILFLFLPDSIIEYIKVTPMTISIKLILLMVFLVIVIFSIIFIRKFGKLLFSKLKLLWCQNRELLGVLTVFFFAYPIFLIISISFMDYTTPLSYRIMLPWIIILEILFFKIAISLVSDNKIATRIFTIIFLFLICSYGVRGAQLINKIYMYGDGYSSVIWKESSIIRFIEQFPPDTVMYTNGGVGILYQTKRETFSIPYKYVNGKLNPRYKEEIAEMSMRLKKNRGYIIYFNNIPSTRLENIKELSNQLGLNVVLKASDGTVLR